MPKQSSLFTATILLGLTVAAPLLAMEPHRFSVSAQGAGTIILPQPPNSEAAQYAWAGMTCGLALLLLISGIFLLQKRRDWQVQNSVRLCWGISSLVMGGLSAATGIAALVPIARTLIF